MQMLNRSGARSIPAVPKTRRIPISATLRDRITSPIDPVLYGAVGLLFVLAASAASYIPARAAANVDPMTAIRA